MPHRKQYLTLYNNHHSQSLADT